MVVGKCSDVTYYVVVSCYFSFFSLFWLLVSVCVPTLKIQDPKMSSVQEGGSKDAKGGELGIGSQRGEQL